MKKRLNDFLESIKKAKSIAIAGHKNPDGDSLCSVLALARLIQLNFKKDVVRVYDGNIPDCLDGVPDREKMLYFNKINLSKKFDLAILLDYGTENQIGGFLPIVNNADRVIEIDHHKNDNPIADICIDDEGASSVGEIIYNIISELKWKIDPDVLDLLAISIMTDTGNLKFVHTGKPLKIMANLVDAGVEIERLLNLLNNKPKKTVLTETRIAANAEFFYRNRLAVAVVGKDDYKNLDGRGDIILNLLLQIKDVEYVVLLKRQKDNQTGVSLRSKTKPILDIAIALGGGGHSCAAGAVIKDTVENVYTKVLDLFRGIK